MVDGVIQSSTPQTSSLKRAPHAPQPQRHTSKARGVRHITRFPPGWGLVGAKGISTRRCGPLRHRPLKGRDSLDDRPMRRRQPHSVEGEECQGMIAVQVDNFNMDAGHIRPGR